MITPGPVHLLVPSVEHTESERPRYYICYTIYMSKFPSLNVSTETFFAAIAPHAETGPSDVAELSHKKHEENYLKIRAGRRLLVMKI